MSVVEILCSITLRHVFKKYEYGGCAMSVLQRREQHSYHCVETDIWCQYVGYVINVKSFISIREFHKIAKYLMSRTLFSKLNEISVDTHKIFLLFI